MEGAIVEDVSDVVLISEMTAEEMFLFDSMESAKAANQYIKLVTKYFVDDKEYQLLVDNDILIKLLEKQELIEEEVERTSWRPEIITWIKYAGKIPSIFFEATALYKGEKVWYNSTVKNKNQRKSKVNIL